MSWKKFNFKSVSHSWHMILLVIWKHSAWAFYRWAVALGQNGTLQLIIERNASVLLHMHFLKLFTLLPFHGIVFVKASNSNKNKLLQNKSIYQWEEIFLI